MLPSYSPSIAVPDKFIEKRRKMLLSLAIFNQGGASQVPMYLINEDKDPITFGGDRILIKPYEQP